MAVMVIVFWLIVCKKFEAISAQTVDNIVFREDNETVKRVGDWCDAGLEDFRPPQKTDTQCLKLRQCMNLVKMAKERNQKTYFCDFNNTIFNESLVCCTINDFDKSREELRRTSTIGNKMDRGSYFSLESCLNRDREFRYYRDAGFHPLKPTVRGYAVDYRKYQHIAAIGWTQDEGIEYNCGGVLISTRYVATAAHCGYQNGKKPDVVSLGNFNLKSELDDYGVQMFRIVSFIRHPQYALKAHYHDIALIRLTSEIKKSLYVFPACLQTTWNENIKTFEAAGYGQKEYLGEKTNELFGVSLNIYSALDCNSSFRDISKLPDGIIDEQFCAISSENHPNRVMDTCLGDSGGPIQYIYDDPFENIKDMFPVVVGLTSFGIGCAVPGQSSVYTKISKYISWIESIVFK